MNTTVLKKTIKFVPVVLLGLCFAACGGDEPNNPIEPAPKTVKSVKMVYLFEVSDDMLQVAEIEASWTNPDGTKESAKVTKPKSQLESTYTSFPATANISMKLTPKSPAPADDKKFELAANCSWYAYQVTYTDGTKNSVTSNAHSSSSMTVLGKDLTKYINERLNPRLSDISFSITLSDSESGISVNTLNQLFCSWQERTNPRC